MLCFVRHQQACKPNYHLSGGLKTCIPELHPTQCSDGMGDFCEFCLLNVIQRTEHFPCFPRSLPDTFHQIIVKGIVKTDLSKYINVEEKHVSSLVSNYSPAFELATPQPRPVASLEPFCRDRDAPSKILGATLG